jgi:hypothetical protein
MPQDLGLKIGAVLGGMARTLTSKLQEDHKEELDTKAKDLQLLLMAASNPNLRPEMIDPLLQKMMEVSGAKGGKLTEQLGGMSQFLKQLATGPSTLAGEPIPQAPQVSGATIGSGGAGTGGPAPAPQGSSASPGAGGPGAGPGLAPIPGWSGPAATPAPAPTTPAGPPAPLMPIPSQPVGGMATPSQPRPQGLFRSPAELSQEATQAEISRGQQVSAATIAQRRQQADAFHLTGRDRQQFILEGTLPTQARLSREPGVIEDPHSKTGYSSLWVDPDNPTAPPIRTDAPPPARTEDTPSTPLLTRMQIVKTQHPDWSDDKIRTEAAKQVASDLDLDNASKRALLQSRQDQGVGLTPGGVDMAAWQYGLTGQLPALGMMSGPLRKQIINRAAELVPPESLAGNAAAYSANRTSLTNMQKMRDAIGSFEQTAKKNITVLEGTMKKLSDVGSPLLNKPWREVQLVSGNTDVAAFNTALRVVINEIAKITSNPTMAGQLSDTARKEVESLTRGDFTIPQMVSTLQVLRQDMENRVESLDDTIGDIKGRLKPGGTATAPASGASFKVGDFTVVRKKQ